MNGSYHERVLDLFSTLQTKFPNALLACDDDDGAWEAAISGLGWALDPTYIDFKEECVQIWAYPRDDGGPAIKIAQFAYDLGSASEICDAIAKVADRRKEAEHQVMIERIAEAMDK